MYPTKNILKMRTKMNYFWLFLLAISLNVSAQNKQITLKDIWIDYAFYPKGMTNLSALKNTNQYTVLNYDYTNLNYTIDLYNFSTLEKEKTLFDTKKFPQIKRINSYTFNKQEDKILIATNKEPIFRRSFSADFYVFDLKKQELTKLTDKKIQEPLFSPMGDKVAYVYKNNIYIYDTQSKKEQQVTFDGEKNKIINGTSDWVYEEEFAIVRTFDWNADGTQLAYVRFDEHEVPEFSMDIYGTTLYPTKDTFKYPKAGEKNSVVSLYLYDVKAGKATQIPLDAYYIPRLQWTKEANILSVQTLNRHQNDFNIIFVDASTKKFKSVYHEVDKAYVSITDDLTFLDDNSFIISSEKDGNNHLYHYDKNGKLIKQITQGKWEVTEYYGYNPKAKQIYYQSTEPGSINRGIYSIALSGKNKKGLATTEGTNEATFSPDFSLFINEYSSAQKPNFYTLNDSKTGKVVKEILNNKELEDKIATYNTGKKEFFELTTKNGDKLNAWMIKPSDFNENKKYPLLMFQYSGPGSQQVHNSFSGFDTFWYYMLAQKGYIVLCVDGRGTGYKGAAFKKCTYKQLGKYELEDQVEAAKIVGNYKYIDKDRIGIWGWSFGGFMASNCILRGEVFKMSIAVAPVTNWRFYATVYTERYMQTPQENPEGYDNNSPLTYAKNLNKKFLLVHGTADDNVHVQNSMRLIESFVQYDKQFEWAIYPDKNHGIYGGNTRHHLYEKLTNFVLNNL